MRGLEAFAVVNISWRREPIMAVYDYKCEKCRKKFTITMPITEHGTKKIKCPKCKSVKVAQVVQPFFVQTSKKS
jgi:putative FmdB family regulatory protein